MAPNINKHKFSIPLFETEKEIENYMSNPSIELINTLSKIEGDILVLGAGGKMGPTLSLLAKNALDKGDINKKVIAVDKAFSSTIVSDFDKVGIQTIECDMLNQSEVDKLPDIENVIYMAGMKFGTSAKISLTWALNTYLPTIVSQKYKNSKIVVFSTGNIYHLTPVFYGGATEDFQLNPFGDYAQSCLGRERMFEYFSERFETNVTIIRLAYAIDLRYGIILDIAQKVFSKKTINLSMGHVNLIWQGDANNQILRSLELCSSPPKILNITGPETISIRWMAKRIGELMDIEPIFEGIESESALLLNATKSHTIFGYPKVTIDMMIQWVAYWVLKGGTTLNKPTHFEQRDGKF